MATECCFNLAEKAFSEKQFEESATKFSLIIDNQNGHREPNTDAYIRRCQCYYNLKQYEKALKDAKYFSDTNVDSLIGHLWKGRCYSKLTQFNEAYTSLRKGLELEPTNAEVADELRSLQDSIMAMYEADERKSENTYNAVDLCTQEPYPGDEELEELEREIMIKWKLDQHPNVKAGDCDLDKAADELTSAIEAKELGQLSSALNHVNMSASCSPGNMFIMEERADILFLLGEFKEGFRSCNIIPFEHRSVSLWTTGGKILDALELPVIAETWLRMATQLAKDTKSEAPLIFQQVRVKRLYAPLADKTNATVTFTRYGRAVMSKESITKGDVIMVDKPVVCAQTLDSQNIPACGHCASSLVRPGDIMGMAYQSNNQLKKMVQKYWPKMTIVPCRHCKKEIYCSVTCQEEAWERYHCLICPEINHSVKKLYKVCDEFENLRAGDSRVWKGWWNAAFSPFMLARIWASIACNARKLGEESGRINPSLADWTKAKAPFRRFIAYGAQSNAEAVPKMFDLMVEIFKDLGDGLSYNITKREFDGRYYQATCNVQAFSDLRNPLKRFLENIKDKPNTRGIMQLLPHNPPEAEFAGLFALHACLNHSCANNAEVFDGIVDNKPGVAVRAKRDVQEGEEVFITYINTNMPRSKRRAWLYRAYNFWCYCDRCNFEGEGSHECTQCKKTAESQKPFPTCSKCKKAWYCSSKCQKVAWKKGHKKICSLSHSQTESSSDLTVISGK
ncbi:uncharacterized protein LOC126818222 [Patella vulgata]|uniref:uncharacterized protein LOC126818222 n=1 Tax=Patella vulgata TaxID=6465 RepID=UPI00218072AF|nr:uncharacterized protein LOC126818222 [Patella vulgata]